MTEIKAGAPIEVLKPEEAQAVEEFKERLLAALPGQVRDIILFGSKARGDGHPESDIDLLVVLENPTKEQTDTVCDITFDILLDRGVELSAITYSREEAMRKRELGTPLMRNVAEEGIIIMGEAIVVGEGKPQEVARGFLDSARERLRSAALLLNSGLYRDSVSRAYYAFLDAADGALASRRITPKSHAGTISLFGLHFIKAGLVDGKYSTWFKKIYKARLDADYKRDRVFTEEEAREALEQATGFVETVEKLLLPLLEE
ncbi:MAG TPA: HEPN domain-containing protein [Anaerolineae bacterium]|nr:HEPN domain-containing protein [Anaerolineae bacterium]